MTGKYSGLLDRLIPIPEGQRDVARGLNATELPMQDRISLVQGGRQSLLGPERDASIRREALEGARTGLAVGTTGVVGTGIASHLAERAASMADDARLNMAVEVLFNALSPDGQTIPSNVASHIPLGFESGNSFRPQTKRMEGYMTTEATKLRDHLGTLDEMVAAGRMSPDKALQTKNRVVAGITGQGAPKKLPSSLSDFESLVKLTDKRLAGLNDPGSYQKSDLRRFVNGPLRAQHHATDDIVADLNRGLVQYFTTPKPKHQIFGAGIGGARATPMERTLLENSLRIEAKKRVRQGRGFGKDVDATLKGLIDAAAKKPEVVESLPWYEAVEQMKRLEEDTVGQAFKTGIRDPLQKVRRYLAAPAIPSMRHAPEKLLRASTRGGHVGTLAGTIAAKGLQAMLSRGGMVAGLGGVVGGVAGAMNQEESLEGMLSKVYQTPEEVRSELEDADRVRSQAGAQEVMPGRPLRDSIPHAQNKMRSIDPDTLAGILQAATAVNIGMPGLA